MSEITQAEISDLLMRLRTTRIRRSDGSSRGRSKIAVEAAAVIERLWDELGETRMDSDAICAIRQRLLDAGVPCAAFIDDHVGNLVNAYLAQLRRRHDNLREKKMLAVSWALMWTLALSSGTVWQPMLALLATTWAVAIISSPRSSAGSEQPTSNRQVEGSNPSVGAKNADQ
jgi:hypothetical protein